MNKDIPDLDMAIYNKNGGESSLRIIGSLKFGKNRDIIDHRFTIPKND